MDCKPLFHRTIIIWSVSVSRSRCAIGQNVFIVTDLAEAKNTANDLGYHDFLVRTNDANRGPTGVRGYHARSLRIARLIQFNAKEAQALTDACADAWRIFADAARKHQRIQSA